MGHIRIFTQPISCLDYLPVFLITHHTRWLSEFRFLILRFFRIQPFTILIVWFPFIVHKKVDTRCQKVNCRCLEKLITTASAFSLSFLQGFQQCLSRLTGHRQILDILFLNGIRSRLYSTFTKLMVLNLQPLGALPSS